MSHVGIDNLSDFHRFTVDHYQDFWRTIITTLNIQFKKQPQQICDLTNGPEAPSWLPHAKMNIVDSCFTGNPGEIALIYQIDNVIQEMTYAALESLSNQIANSLIARGFKNQDAIAIIMPMNHYAVALYLGIIKMGGIVVSIADSFSSDEIATRLHIANAKAVFTQHVTAWAGRKLQLYDKISQTNIPCIILTPDPNHTSPKRPQDITWDHFLLSDQKFESYSADPMQMINILFSSGTTALPKAIPWTHVTPIKAASDAYFHQNIQSHDILAWPTNLGWMMGPWLVFAALINKATIALYTDTPMEKPFGEFVQNAHVTMLGIVPTLVARWRRSKCMESFDWQQIKVFSSTGECSHEDDMSYLMSLAGGKPIIEYCGGTEIGGAYLSSTVIQDNYPSLFSTPTMGTNFVLLDDKKQIANEGEVAIITPAIGLSTVLLNNNHHDIYFKDMPKGPHGETMRRHGDALKKLKNGYYRMLGRTDDTMNLGGIKVSAVEIERALSDIPELIETAAIGRTGNHRFTELVIYAVTTNQCNKSTIMQQMQNQINRKLNPLFKIHEIIYIDALPKTASNKMVRRLLS